jgi:DNA polymerase-3 subunit epsilon
MKGERVFILGEARDGRLAQLVADAGGRIVSSIGSTTTMLVISNAQPFGRWVSASPPYRKADTLRGAGQSIVLIGEEALSERIGIHGVGAAAFQAA